MDAEKGIQFLQNELNNKGIDLKIFNGKPGPYEMRLYVGQQSFNSRENQIVEIVTEGNQSELYSVESKTKLFKKISNFKKTRGHMIILVDQVEYRFICSIGGVLVVVD